MIEKMHKRLPGRTALLVFVLLLIAVVAAQADDERAYVAASPVVQADSGLLMRRMASVALELVGPKARVSDTH
jgi:hypothetical protein